MKQLKKTVLTLSILTATGIAILAHGTANATVLAFTNQAAWEAELSGAAFLTETFDGGPSSFGANTFGNPAGLVTIDVDGDPGLNPVGLTGTGFFQGFVQDVSGSDVEQGFNRPNMIGVAFLGLQIAAGENTLDLQEIGFDFGDGSVAGFEFLACEVVGTCTPNPPNEVPDATNLDNVAFIGFIFNDTLGSFQIDHGDDIRDLNVNGSEEPFLIDGLIFAEAAAVNIPEPSTLALLSLGFAGLSYMRRRATAAWIYTLRT